MLTISHQCTVESNIFECSIIILCYTADFTLDAYTVEFNSSATLGQRECYTFRPVQDIIVESNETMRFEIVTENLLDMLGDRNGFQLVIYDDDGMYNSDR